MAKFYHNSYLAVLVAIFFVTCPAFSAPLKKGFYKKTCPSAEIIVRNTVRTALTTDSGVAAALIRLHFHDCFVRGCDASILLDSTATFTAEKYSMGNKGIGGFEVIDAAKSKIEAQCPNTVSCADIVAFAARDGVFFTGGLNYTVLGGRRDGKISLSSEVSKNLPDSFFNVTQLKQNFAAKGLTLHDMVTLSGAHSIGDSHCSSFSKRLYSNDPSLDPAYASYLRATCPKPTNSSSVDPIVAFDPDTPTSLDNNYYKRLVGHKGLLFSDQVLWDTPLTKNLVRRYVDRPSEWATRFAAAMVKMGSIEVLTGSQGEIRKNCRVVN